MYIKDSDKKTGISTACFYPMLLENAFDIICDKLKYKVCELFINTKSETKINFLKKIKSKADDNGIKISSIHPYMSGFEPMLFLSEYKRRTLDSIKLYSMFFEAAQYLKADYIIFHGIGPKELKMPVSEYTERFLLIAEEAKKYNVELLHENVGNINYHIKEIIKINKNIRFTLDFKHAVTRGFDISDIIETMGNNIAHIHLNDMYTKGFSLNKSENFAKIELCRLPFSGDLDFNKIFKKLAEIKYTGVFITEVYKDNYTDENEILESKEKTRNALSAFPVFL